MSPTDPLILAAEAFYRRCPTEIARDGDAIRRKTWEELTEQERFHVVEGVREAMDAVGSAETAKWSPMKTAPRDHRVLVFNGYAGIYASQWHRGQWPWLMFFDDDPLAQLADERSEIAKRGLGVGFPRPTLWMPLPPEPSLFGRLTQRSDTSKLGNS
jgi:hypothetical protein